MKTKKRNERPGKARPCKLSSAKAESRARRQDDKPVYTEDGVDLTLIRWMLSLTPAQRLDALDNGTLRKRIKRSARIRRNLMKDKE